MAIIQLDLALSNQIGAMSWGVRRYDIVSTSMFGSQVVEVSGPRWLCGITVPALIDLDAGAWKALSLRLKGRVNQIELWDVRRPVPRGTMRGVMTLTSAVLAGAEVLPISAGVGQAGTTLRVGDWLQIGSGSSQHLVMATADAIADGAGNIVVPIGHPLREGFAIGTGVIWERPKGLFRIDTGEAQWDYSPGVVNGFGFSFIEDWRP